VPKFGERLSNNLGVYAVKTRSFRRDSAAIWRRSSFVTLSFRNGLEDRNFYFRRVIGNHFCTSCINLVRFSSVTTKFSLLKKTTFTDGKNWHITPNTSEYPGPILTYFTALVGELVGMTIPIFIWWSHKGCHGNQLNLGDVRRWRQERPLIVTLAFDNGLADREAAIKWLNGINRATLCTNLVNFCSIVAEFTLLKCAILPRNLMIELHSSSWHSEMD